MRPEGYDYDTHSRLAGPLTEPEGGAGTGAITTSGTAVDVSRSSCAIAPRVAASSSPP